MHPWWVQHVADVLCFCFRPDRDAAARRRILRLRVGTAASQHTTADRRSAHCSTRHSLCLAWPRQQARTHVFAPLGMCRCGLAPVAPIECAGAHAFVFNGTLSQGRGRNSQCYIERKGFGQECARKLPAAPRLASPRSARRCISDDRWVCNSTRSSAPWSLCAESDRPACRAGFISAQVLRCVLARSLDQI